MRRSSSTAVLLLSSLAAYAALALAFGADPAAATFSAQYHASFYLLLGGCATSAVAMFLVNGKELFRIIAAAHFFALLLFQQLYGYVFTYELSLAVLFVVPLAAYQSFPSNLIACGIFVVVSALFRGETLIGTIVGGPAALRAGQLFYVLVTGAFSVVTSFMTLYRERIIDHQNEIDELRAVGARLAEANLSVQNYAQNVRESTLSQERKRLTREVHDSVGYLVTNVSMALEAIRLMATREPQNIPELVDRAREQVELGLQEMRQALRDLRGTPIDRVSGAYSIRRLVTTFATATGIDVRVEYGNAHLGYDDVVQTVIYRFIQEGMINAFRHGSATAIVVQFWQSERSLSVTVWDNGTIPDEVHEGIGIAGMRERLDLVRGTLHVSIVPEGFSITITIPLAELAPHVPAIAQRSADAV